MYINDELVDENPFTINVNGDFTTTESLIGQQNLNLTAPITSSSSNDLSRNSTYSNSDSMILKTCSWQSNASQSAIFCSKTKQPFHFVVNYKNLQNLCVYDPFNSSISFKLGEDDYDNGSVIIIPERQGKFEKFKNFF